MNKFLQIIPTTLVLTSIGFIANINSLAAQTKINACQPPNSGEYLLLIVSPTQDNQDQLHRVLPIKTNTTVCKYLSNTVTRIGGFAKLDDANRWARYVKDSAGLSAIITTRPSGRSQPQTVSYKPQALGAGFAVLVDYLNRPEVASKVQKLVQGDIGFVSYGQRHYLLATYTTNQQQAYATLQKLSENGFYAVIVDGRKVILLRPTVQL